MTFYALSSREIYIFATIISILISIVFGVIPLFPINKRLIKKYSEYVNGINKIVENEILELKNKSKSAQ